MHPRRSIGPLAGALLVFAAFLACEPRGSHRTLDDAPRAQAPRGNAPASETPDPETPGTDTPDTDTPDTDTPDTGPAVERGERLLGIAISDRSDGDFEAAYKEAVDAGLQVISLPLAWDDLETSPGVYAPSPDFLAIAASFYPSRGSRLILEINPIDTNNERVPDYLDGRAWNDPELVQAFEDLLDWTLPRAAGIDLVALSIGNEIDATLASETAWKQYTDFFARVASYARRLRPGVPLATKVSKDGHIGPFAAQAAAINEYTDVVLTTYYPLAGDFRVQRPETVHGVFDDITSRYPGRTVFFSEIGSPSTSRCGSSEALQADFVREAFEAWDEHADQIGLLEWVWMHDISGEILDFYETYYGLSNSCFLDFLATLGLKHSDGGDKPAWRALVEEAGRRGW